MSVGAVRPLLRAVISPACIPPDPRRFSQPALLLDRDRLSQLPALFQSCFFNRQTKGRGVAGCGLAPGIPEATSLCGAAKLPLGPRETTRKPLRRPALIHRGGEGKWGLQLSFMAP